MALKHSPEPHEQNDVLFAEQDMSNLLLKCSNGSFGPVASSRTLNKLFVSFTQFCILGIYSSRAMYLVKAHMFQDILVVLLALTGLYGFYVFLSWAEASYLRRAWDRSERKLLASGSIPAMRPYPFPSSRSGFAVFAGAALEPASFVSDEDDDRPASVMDRLRASINFGDDDFSSGTTHRSALDTEILPNGREGFRDGYDLSGRHWSEDSGFDRTHD